MTCPPSFTPACTSCPSPNEPASRPTSLTSGYPAHLQRLDHQLAAAVSTPKSQFTSIVAYVQQLTSSLTRTSSPCYSLELIRVAARCLGRQKDPFTCHFWLFKRRRRKQNGGGAREKGREELAIGRKQRRRKKEKGCREVKKGERASFSWVLGILV